MGDTFTLLPEDINTPTVADSLVKNLDIYPDTGIITKPNFNQYGQVDSVSIQNEVHTVYRNKIILEQIPSSYYRVSIQGYQEIITNQTLVGNQFRVIYPSGIIYFASSEEGKQITVNQYYGTGVEMIPASRIYLGTDEDGNITNTLYDMIKVGTNAIIALDEVGGVLIDGKATAQRLESDTTLAETVDSQLERDTETAKNVDSKLVSDTILARDVDSKLVVDTKVADTTNTTLNTTITTGNQLNNNLNSSNNAASVNIEVIKQEIVELQDTVQNATIENITLAKTIESATQVNSTLVQDTTKAININETLAKTTSTSNSLNTTLDESITAAKSINTTLVLDSETATNINTKLESNIQSGNTLNTNLSGNITTGNTLDTALKNTITIAQGLNLDVSKNTQVVNNVGENTTKINTLGQTVAKNTLTIGQEVSDLEEMISEKVSGSVNLFSNANFGTAGYTFSSTVFSGGQCADVPCIVGREYTLTALIDGKGSTEYKIGCFSQYSGSEKYEEFYTFPKTDGLEVISVTFKPTKNVPYLLGLYTTDGKDKTMYWFTLTEGNVASSYCLSEKEMANNELATQLSTLGSTVASMNTSISTGSVNTTNGTNAYQINGKNVIYSDGNGVHLENMANGNGINIDNSGDITYTNGSNTYNVMTTGNTPQSQNLIVNSNFTGNNDGNGGLGGTAYGFAFTSTGCPVQKGKTYTFTACGYAYEKTIENGGKLLVNLYDSTWSKTGASLAFTETTATIKSATFVAGETEFLYVDSYLAPQEVSKDSGVVIEWYTLVEGEVGTFEWIPCSYDLIGGNNIFTGSYFKNGFTTTTDGAAWNTTTIELQAGVPYTLTVSGTVANNNNGSGMLACLYNSDWSEGLNVFISETSPVYQYATFIPATTQTFQFGIYSRDMSGKAYGDSVTLNWYTLNAGGRPQYWTPSIDEIKGNTEPQLMALGHSTTELMIQNSQIQTQNKVLGENTARLMLSNQMLESENAQLNQEVSVLKMQNEILGKNSASMMLENSQLKEQNMALGKQIVEIQLKLAMMK